MTNLNPNSDRIKTRHLQNLIARKHNGDGWCLMFELANTLYMTKSRADALAVDLYKNKIHGYEIKASRGDWLNELKHPEKSAHIAQYCDYWWIAAPKGMIDPSELPSHWGLIESTKAQLRIKVKAPLRDKNSMSVALIGSMLRNMNNQHKYPRDDSPALMLSESSKPLDLTKTYKTRDGRDVHNLRLVKLLHHEIKIKGNVMRFNSAYEFYPTWYLNGQFDNIAGEHCLDLIEAVVNDQT